MTYYQMTHTRDIYWVIWLHFGEDVLKKHKSNIDLQRHIDPDFDQVLSTTRNNWISFPFMNYTVLHH